MKQIQATSLAFAAILADESVVTWGDPGIGGDSSQVQGQLRNVQQIQATSLAFAAMIADGSVVTWGRPSSGGDSSTVQDQLQSVLPSLLMDPVGSPGVIPVAVIVRKSKS